MIHIPPPPLPPGPLAVLVTGHRPGTVSRYADIDSVDADRAIRDLAREWMPRLGGDDILISGMADGWDVEMTLRSRDAAGEIFLPYLGHAWDANAHQVPPGDRICGNPPTIKDSEMPSRRWFLDRNDEMVARLEELSREGYAPVVLALCCPGQRSGTQHTLNRVQRWVPGARVFNAWGEILWRCPRAGDAACTKPMMLLRDQPFILSQSEATIRCQYPEGHPGRCYGWAET